MTLSSESPKILNRALLALGAGACLALSFPPYSFPLLLPFGVALLLLSLRGGTLRQRLFCGLLCGSLYFGGTLFWLANLFGLAAVSLCAILISFVLVFAGVFGWLERRLNGWNLGLSIVLLWVVVEWFRSEPFVLHFGWMGLGYGVVNSVLLAQMASVVGCYGVSACIVGYGVGLAYGGKRALWGIPIWLLLLWFPASPPRVEHPMRVRLIQAMSQSIEEFTAFAKSEGVAPDLILMPEYSFLEDPRKDRRLWEKVVDIAKSSKAYLLFVAKDQFDPADADRFRNTAFLLNPSGEIIGTHVKNHTVHFIQDGVPGRTAQSIATPLGRLGVAICFDMDYPDVARRLVQDGAEVYLVPNMDPSEWGGVQRVQHRLMFQMRAAECGRWLARADVSGGTSLAAPNGQEVRRIGGTQEGFMDVEVGRTDRKTLYVLGGWLFPYGCLVGLLVLVGRALYLEKRRQSPHSIPHKTGQGCVL